MKKSVSVPLMSLMPCASLPNSFDRECSQTALCFSLLMRCLYSIDSPVTFVDDGARKEILVRPFVHLEGFIGVAKSSGYFAVAFDLEVGDFGGLICNQAEDAMQLLLIIIMLVAQQSFASSCSVVFWYHAVIIFDVVWSTIF